MAKGDLIGQIRRAIMGPGAPSSDFDLNPGVVLADGRKLRDAAVLMPLLVGGVEAKLILTKRSSALKHHPGQIAFPGGKVDAGDGGPIDAALREAREEIGLPPDNVEIIGALGTHETVTGFRVTPVVALVREPFTPKPEPGEVDEVFSVPLRHVLDVRNYRVESRIWRGQRRYYQTVPYGPYYIWGATARMLRGLADRMAA